MKKMYKTKGEKKIMNQMYKTIAVLVVVLGTLQTAAATVIPPFLSTGHAFIWDSTAGIQSLGTLPGGSNSFAISINNLGQVAGYGNIAGNNPYHAVVWNKKGATYVPNDIGTLPGGIISIAQGINNLGQVAGVGQSATGYFHAIVWDQKIFCLLHVCIYKYSPTDLGTLPGGVSSGANAINNLGQLAGEGDIGAGQARAIMWNKIGSNYLPTDLGILSGGTFSIATSINGLGQVVGYGSNATGKIHAIEWDQKIYCRLNICIYRYTPTDLGALPGGTSSYAYGINNLGQITGSSGNDTVQSHAVVWNKKVAKYIPTNIGTLPGRTIGIAQKISNLGQVVGESRTVTGKPHAVLWKLVNSKYIPTDLKTLTGDPSSYAYGINDIGQVVGISGNFPLKQYI